MWCKRGLFWPRRWQKPPQRDPKVRTCAFESKTKRVRGEQKGQKGPTWETKRDEKAGSRIQEIFFTEISTSYKDLHCFLHTAKEITSITAYKMRPRRFPNACKNTKWLGAENPTCVPFSSKQLHHPLVNKGSLTHHWLIVAACQVAGTRIWCIPVV